MYQLYGLLIAQDKHSIRSLTCVIYSFTTEKECYKWVDHLWDEWFEEAYAECKAGVLCIVCITVFVNTSTKVLLQSTQLY